MSSVQRALRVGATALVFAARAGAEVHIVSPLVQGAFLDVQDAIDAASDGDLIVVYEGSYSSILIDDLAVAILGWPSQVVTTGPIRVQNLAAGKLVVLSGLQVPLGPEVPDPAEPALTASSCAGSLRLQDCSLAGQTASTGSAPDGMVLIDCDDVAISNSWTLGGARTGYVPGISGDGGRGLYAVNSRVAAHGSQFWGRYGQSLYNVGDGGDGVACFGSQVHLTGSSIEGGAGGDDQGGDPPGDGGNALVIGAGSIAFGLRNELLPGRAGASCWIACKYGIEGQALVVESGAEYVEVSGPVHSLRISPIGFDSDSVAMSVEGLSAARVALNFSYSPGHDLDPGLSGVFQLGKPLAHAAPQQHGWRSRMQVPLVLDDGQLGSIPDSGVLELEIVVGPILEPSSVLLVQAEAIVDGERRLTNSRAVFLPNCADLDQDCHLGRVYVDVDASASCDGTTWAQAFDRLQPALEREGVEVWVAEGTYRPGILGTDSFILEGNIEVYGGFAGHEHRLEQRDLTRHPSVLSGDLAGDDGPGFLHRSDNSFHVVRLLPNYPHAPRLDGFHVRGGSANNDPNNVRGGGIHVEFEPGFTDAVVLANCEVYDNEAREGGGLGARLQSVLIASSRFLGNRAQTMGGGVFLQQGLGARIVNSVFCGNRAAERGAGLYSFRTHALELVDCSLGFNQNEGSGIQGGAGAWIESSSASNQAAVRNSIFWRNEHLLGGGEDAQLHFEGPVTAEVGYSCIEGLASLPGPGNIGVNPRWSDAAGDDGVHGTLDDDLSLILVSPCIDAGSNALLPADDLDLDLDLDALELLPSDLAGAPRRRDVPGTPDTGEGRAPIVDMGAYEKQP